MFPQLNTAILSAIALVVLFAPGFPETHSGSTKHPDLAVNLDQYVAKVSSDNGFSGSVLVARRKEILLHKGYGWADRLHKFPVTADTKFYIASITKQFAAAAILKLQEQGRLSVTDSISRYFKDVPPDKAGITIHQLLTHTSGLKQNYAADGITDRTEAVRAVLSQHLKNQPGQQFGYGNDGYSLIAAIIEIASGETYETFLRRHFLKKAGMSHTGFWGESPAKGEARIADTRTDINTTANWGFRGGVGMFSTTGDLYKWCRALLSDKVLTRQSRDLLLGPYVSTSRGHYTYGWFRSKTDNGLEVYWNAVIEGFVNNGIIKMYADGTIIIVISNAGNISGTPARDFVSSGLEHIVFSARA